ncbi:helix-turn-helix domain-containing protein [Bradyrhizobium sp. CCGUVB1N3]|nr:helix-turn-helix domain-containing protein [Bradyrhizobium sp. CCGUVB1N3]
MLTCAEGGQNTEVTAKLGLDRQTLGKWRRRFMEQRVAGLHDEPRSGAPRTIDDARIEAVIVRTLESWPESATHWSSRDMAKTSGHPSDQPRLDSPLLPAPRQSSCNMGLLPSRRKANGVNTKT